MKIIINHIIENLRNYWKNNMMDTLHQEKLVGVFIAWLQILKLAPMHSKSN